MLADIIWIHLDFLAPSGFFWGEANNLSHGSAFLTTVSFDFRSEIVLLASFQIPQSARRCLRLDSSTEMRSENFFPMIAEDWLIIAKCHVLGRLVRYVFSQSYSTAFLPFTWSSSFRRRLYIVQQTAWNVNAKLMTTSWRIPVKNKSLSMNRPE